ncbi:hypothetical protein [Streptomyces sp. NPDC050287]|uniref:hypothetical protein n=1 Tax=Streptomyces sp. NPDC050287 TaxID=3365608 RepID=UPI0037953D5A
MSVSTGLSALLGGAATLILGRRKPTPAQIPLTGPGTNRRKALETVALGLQAVAARPHAARPLPAVHAVVYSGSQLTLRLADAHPHAPAPWTADASGKEWWVRTADLRQTGTGADGPAHPYSLTVTLGLHQGDRVLVDLAQLPGAISLTGDDHDILRFAQTIITELISGPVGVHAQVVLVGSAATPSVTEGLGTRSARLRTAATRDVALSHTDDAPPAPAPADAATDTRRLFVVTAAQFRDGSWENAVIPTTDALLVLGHIPDPAHHLEINPDGSLNTGRLSLPIDAHTACLP